MKALRFAMMLGVAGVVSIGCARQAPPPAETGQADRASQPAPTRPEWASAPTSTPSAPAGSTSSSGGGTAYVPNGPTHITMERPGGGPSITLPVPNLNGTLSNLPVTPQLTIIEPVKIQPAPYVEPARPSRP